MGLVALEVRLDRGDGLLVILVTGKLQQLGGIAEAALEPPDDRDDGLETRALAAKRLRPLRVVPDLRILELAPYLLESLAACRDVKGTPSGRPNALAYLRYARQWR
jgi:hypothetical protein